MKILPTNLPLALNIVERNDILNKYPKTLLNQVIGNSSPPRRNTKLEALHGVDRAGSFSHSKICDVLLTNDIDYNNLLEISARSTNDLLYASSEIPDWLEFSCEAFKNHKIGSYTSFDSTDFNIPVAPLLAETIDRIYFEFKRINTHLPDHFINIETVMHGIANEISTRLSHICARALVAELHIASRTKALQGKTPKENYTRFFNKLFYAPLSCSFLERYPVLVNICATFLLQFKTALIELLQRVGTDYSQLTKVYSPNTPLGRLSHIEFGLGDSHCGGRSVAKLEFESGCRIIYKPRSLSNDVYFQTCLRTLMTLGDFPNYLFPIVLTRQHYGYNSYVEHVPCERPEQLDRFFYRHGVQLALLHVLGVSDLHSENLIAHGEIPVVIDLETLLQPVPKSNCSVSVYNQALSYVQQSVQSSGLLPQKLLINDRAKSIDISGLSQIEGQLSPIPLPVWKNVGLDSMSLVREHVTFSRTQNLPMYEDNEVTAEDHLQHLYSGFQSACRVIAQNKSSFRNLFQNTAECRGRVVLRPTYLYEHILEESLHPHLLGDALAREQYFNQLWIQHQDSKLKSIYVAEHGDLWVGDIPFFFTMPKCRSIFTSAGSEIGDFFAQSGMDAALQRLDMMSDEYSKGQLWFLDISFNGKESTASSRRLHVEQNDSASLLDEAVRIGNKIVSDAFVDEEMAAWVTVREVRDGNYEPIVSGIDLYSGISGISLFLTYLWKATADRNFYDFAVASIKCLCSLIRDGEFQDAPLTLGDGLGGLLYLSIHSNDVLKDSHSFELMNYCLERLYSKDFESHDVDILSGSAGIALSSLSCFKATGNPIALDIALKNGRNLLKNLADLSITSDLLTARSLERGSWSGFGHGLFGVIAAVSEISKFVSDQQYKAESDKLITRFSKIALTLPGMRDSASWCRGYTGSLIALLTILDPDTLDKRTRMLIKSSLNKYVESRILPSDCACHGELGNLELLLHPNTRKVADFSVDSAVSSRLRMVKDRAVRLGWHCGSQAENPSLFEGLSGIGYQLLRLQDPVITPSFLRFEGPPSPPK